MATPAEFTWDARTGQYRRANGRFVTRAEIRAAIDQALQAETRRARSLTAQLRDGTITLEQWRLDMRQLIKTVHLFDAAAAKGGWAQLTQADYGRVGQIVRSEYHYLEQRALAIASGKTPLDGRLQMYAQMYAQAGRQTYHAVERTVMLDAGFTQERNVLHPAEHCQGCLRETARGWVPIGALVPITQRDCLRNDQCSLEYR